MHAPPIQHYRQYEIRGDRPDQREAEKRPAAIALLHHEVFIAAQSHLRGKLEEMRAGRDEDERGEHDGDEPDRPERHAQSPLRSEEHTSELQSLMRISYAVF